MKRTYIVLRQSPDWGSISDSEFREQSREFCKLIKRPPEEVNMSVDLWNRTFKRSFLDVRQEIKEIALANFGFVENAEILNGMEITNSTIFEEGFYIFIDDDDWLHPQISKLLSNINNSQEVDAVVWGSVLFKGHITRRNIDEFCYTNNYAISEKFLKTAPRNYHHASQHFRANSALRQRPKIVIHEYWSITNKNPASATYLKSILNGNYSSPQLLKDALEDYLYLSQHIDAEIDSSLVWARPLMNKIIRIFSELL